MSDTSDSFSELRASDADRERVVEMLPRAAADGQLTVDELEERVPSAYTARTRKDLEPLIADLSVETQPGSARAAGFGEQSGLTVREGGGGARWVISIMGGHDKRGSWRLGRRCTVLNLMSGNDAKLCDEVTPPDAPSIHIRLVSILGGSSVVRGRKPTKEEHRREPGAQRASPQARTLSQPRPPGHAERRRRVTALAA